ncbi:SSS family solute:Na+ symporter [Scopulibacillus darangshiensis]|uniref:SSS family solute:Na+ symporter n=1 Tax=Scopulibacillus darangshiensis TaxID=442528 RepID=A0A4R2P996_9BACL|nr:sodium:solute symporter [Scopulibacillus darangshiensis]TCP30908.1 SSS family solute:Na+ symporter [Scopulibacillus darangshiensis]
MNIALIIIFFFLLISIYLGIRSRKGKDMELEQWSVGGRGFGTVFVFLLMAGETFTTFTFLGGSGWAYGNGIAALYIICYGCLMFILSYWILPVIWKYGKDKSLVSQADFFAHKYKSTGIGVVVSLVGIIALIPYLTLQLKGLGLIVSVASNGSISYNTAIWIGLISVIVYVTLSGVHGSAWTSVIKDILILLVVVFLGVYLPIHYYGGFESMFKAIETADPGFLTLKGNGLSVSWFISSALVSALGAYMWPHSFGAAYTAKNPDVFKKNAIVLPLYELILLFAFMVGFAAILQIPNLKDTDMALLALSKASFPPWFLGVIGGAGLLTALVPGSLILMSTATLISKNLYKPFKKSASDREINIVAKSLVPIVGLIAAYFTFNGGGAIVQLLLMGYGLITQVFPSFVFSLMKRNPVTKVGAGAGILVGVLIIAYTTITGITIGQIFPAIPQAIKDINVGIYALLANVVVTLIVSALTKRVNQNGLSQKTESTGKTAIK